MCAIGVILVMGEAGQAEEAVSLFSKISGDGRGQASVCQLLVLSVSCRNMYFEGPTFRQLSAATDLISYIPTDGNRRYHTCRPLHIRNASKSTVDRIR